MKAGGGRAKGHSFERYVANRLKPYFPNAKRGLQGRDGAEAPDVEGAGFMWIECKRGRQPNIREAMGQAMTAIAEGGASPETYPVIVTKADHDEVLVTLRFDDWLRWLLIND